MKHLSDVFDFSRHVTTFVFGPPGSGKSSMRTAIYQLCRTQNILPVTYEDFGHLIRKQKLGKEVLVEDHLAEIFRLTLRTLIEDSGKIMPVFEDEEKKIIRNQLWLYVSEYEKDPLITKKLENILRPDLGLIKGELPDDIRERWARFCRYVVELFGYNYIYILVDPNQGIL